MIFNFFLTPGEWRVVPGCPGDWQGVLYCHGIRVFCWHYRDLLDGPFQPASVHTFPRGPKEIPSCTGQSYWSSSRRLPGVKRPDVIPSPKWQMWPLLLENPTSDWDCEMYFLPEFNLLVWVSGLQQWSNVLVHCDEGSTVHWSHL